MECVRKKKLFKEFSISATLCLAKLSLFSSEILSICSQGVMHKWRHAEPTYGLFLNTPWSWGIPVRFCSMKNQSVNYFPWCHLFMVLCKIQIDQPIRRLPCSPYFVLFLLPLSLFLHLSSFFSIFSPKVAFFSAICPFLFWLHDTHLLLYFSLFLPFFISFDWYAWKK